MKLGFHMGPVVLTGLNLQQQWREHLDQVAAARDHGFDFVSVGTHVVVHPFQYFNIHPWLAAITARAPELTVVSSVVLVPLADPIEVAAQVATLDVLCDGKFRFGAGLGYRPVEFDIFETSLRHRAKRFEEALVVMKKLWTGKPVTHSGRFFTLDNVTASVTPRQAPHPPVWIATNSEPATRRAAIIGDAPFWSPFLGGDALRRHHELYLDTLAAHGRPFPAEVPIAREYSVGRTRAEAISDGSAGMLRKWEVYAEHGLQGSLSEGDKRLIDDFEVMAKDTFVLGDPAECADEILKYGEEYGITHMKLRLQYPGMSHDKVMERIALSGDVAARLTQ
ncbi:MAG: LLM class flavin-dependent oxidoreductase [Actinomycetota bacterium]|nr:LLM class flavin-dependent oxidoreductase [Actinomycetota bacterium]